MTVAGGAALLGTLGVAAVMIPGPSTEDASGLEAYVGSDECGSCHFVNHDGWMNTLHATMVREATPETVVGDFVYNNEYWLRHGVSRPVPPEEDRLLVRMVREGNEFYAYVHDPDVGYPTPFRITHVVGTAFRQVYLIESKGIFFRVPLVWAIHQKRWVDFWSRQTRSDVTVEGPMAALIAPNGHWDESCARCHTTGYQAEDGGQWAELGIACESCHGPGAAHVEQFRDSKRLRLRSTVLKTLGIETDMHVVRPSLLDPNRAVSLCGQCHQADAWTRTIPKIVAYEPGEDLSVHFREIPLEPNTVDPPSNKTWPDGSPRGPGLLFRSFVDSRCFLEGGLVCHDCHATHEPGEYAELLVPGPHSDRLCLECHEGIAGPGGDVAAHTHHEPGEGSRCYGCHMPKTLEGLTLVGDYDYGRVRTHEVDHVPYPEASVEAGGTGAMPNACNDCHADKTAEWAAKWAGEWYGPRERVAEEIAARRAAAAGGPTDRRGSGL